MRSSNVLCGFFREGFPSGLLSAGRFAGLFFLGLGALLVAGEFAVSFLRSAAGRITTVEAAGKTGQAAKVLDAAYW